MKYSFIIFALLIISCGGGSSTPDSNNTTGNPLVGTWISNCFQSNNNPENIWAILEYTFTETEIENIYTYFSDSNCTTPYSGTQNLWPGSFGTYVELSPVMTTSGIESNWYEITANTVPPLPSDLVVEMGFIVANDELNLVLEDNGSYIISSIILYKQ